jgi:hypothetical protein
LLSLAYSCKDDDNPVKDDDPVDTTPTIELIATDGLVIEVQSNVTTVDYHTQIKNTGDEDIMVLAKMEIIELAEAHWTYFCWGDIASGEGTCYPAMKEDFTATFDVVVKAGETTDPGSFINYIDNESTSSNTSKIRYIVYEDGNMDNADTLEYTINVKNPLEI